MKIFKIEDKSEKEALEKFLLKTGYSREFIVGYEVMDNSSEEKDVILKITYDELGYFKMKSKEILKSILDFMDLNNYDIEESEGSQTITMNIVTEDASLLIGKDAQTLDSLQHIFNKILNKMGKVKDITIDVEHYRYNFINDLKEKIDRKVEYVIRTGRREKLNPLVSILRKDVHNYVKGIKGVKTESVGEGMVKTIYICPKNYNNNRHM